MLHVDARLNAKQRTDKMGRGSRPGRAVVGVLGIGLGPGSKVFQIAHACRHHGPHRESMLNDGGHRDGNEVAEGVVAELAVDVRKERKHGKRRQREVRAIGRRGLEHIKRNAPACARPVVDHCSVPGERAACELFANTACHDVTRTARRKSVINLDLFDRQAGLREGM